MKFKLLLMSLALSFSFNGHGDVNRQYPVLKGPLMGQKPPGMMAEPFAPGIISKSGWELEGVFAPGMEEFYFTTRNGKGTPIMVTGFRQQNGLWKKYTQFKRQGEVTFSPDGQRMHMAEGYQDRKGGGWTERQSLGPMFDREDYGIMRLSASNKGTYVFDDYKSDDLIRISTLNNGVRQAPKPMGPMVNTGEWTAHPFIAPDESYLIWDSERKGGYGGSDLYISFRQENDSWGPAINMGEQVNSAGWDAYATVTPDGKHMLFNRGMNEDNSNVDIYWIDAKIIEQLRVESHDQSHDQSNGQAPEASTNEATLPFSDLSSMEQAYIDANPADKQDGLAVGKLGNDGGNKKLIMQLAQEMKGHKHGNFDSLLIAHKDKLIFESYFLRGRINLPHPQASATKAYTSLALGRAIQLGHLSMADLDRPLINFLTDVDRNKLAKGAQKITLNHALTMRSGIRISDEKISEIENNPTALKGQKQVQALLQHSAPITSESQSFLYQFDPTLVMQVIEAVVPGTAKDFIEKELLDKMGITNYRWETDVSGLPRAGAYSSMTSRDMIKWGLLTINKGQWKGEQLVSAEFITRATSKIVDQSDEYDHQKAGITGTAYGYYWWQADLHAGGKSHLSKSARGGSGQNIIVIEDLDLVIATTTHRDVDDPVAVTAASILPAFID